jgi:hypothetical protein
MGIDEEGTLAQLKFLRKTLVDPTIAHRGRHIIRQALRATTSEPHLPKMRRRAEIFSHHCSGGSFSTRWI